MKLGKTATGLLKKAYERASYWETYQYDINYGHRSYTKTKWGDRDYNASRKLVDLGFAKFVSSTKHVEQCYHAYGSDHWTESTYELTEAGINLAKELFS